MIEENYAVVAETGLLCKASDTESSFIERKLSMTISDGRKTL